MSSINNPKYPWIIRLLFGETTVVAIIALNAVVLFLDEFPEINARTQIFYWIDYGILIYFIIEATVKICLLGFRTYWVNGWNQVDFVIVLAGLPLLVDPFIPSNLKVYAVLPLLRMGRFLRFLRVMRFVPNAAHIGQGVVRALKASYGVFIVLFGLNLLLAMGANMLFGEEAPEHFGDPLIALYSLFKVFTIEGWYEIPDALAARDDISVGFLLAVRIYFIISVLLGGILGLSLANAVFVDEMTTDNNDELIEMVAELRNELQVLRAEVNQQIRPEQAAATSALLPTTSPSSQQDKQQDDQS